MRQKFGFTLVELLMVVIIIAIIAALAIPKFVNAKLRAQEASTKQQLLILRNALQNFNNDTGMWPINSDDLAATTAPAQAYNEGGQAKSLDPTTYKGPYVSAPTIPPDLSGWVQYSWVGGGTKAQYTCPQNGTALDGTLYSSW